MNKRVVAFAFALAMLAGTVSAAGRRPGLALYKGKYPFDRVAGVTFIGHPAVRAAVRRAAPSPAMAATLLSAGVATPIDVSPVWIASGACEPHNCGEHDWAILINRRTGQAIVCHKPEGGRAAWFKAGRRIGGGDSCPAEIKDVPAAILRSAAN
jgi:hypothetical protein